ncbi:hypothetical protein [Oscillatoria nigro-viridis]|uniref:hypothetical protein n=1 Tax=Phormidium nigroviride TaxID=482564 RepID=UPI0002E9C3C9|nr:hypothetical protein [Oscillatoria nigro-viridis]
MRAKLSISSDIQLEQGVAGDSSLTIRLLSGLIQPSHSPKIQITNDSNQIS